MKDARTPNLQLKDARAQRGWSQADLAERVGTSNVSISRWESGSHFPSPHFRQRLSSIFEMTTLELGLYQSVR